MRGRYELFYFIFILVPVYIYYALYADNPSYFSTHAHCTGPDRPDHPRENRTGEAVRHAHGETAKICAQGDAHDIRGCGVSIRAYASQCEEVEHGIQGTTVDPGIHYMKMHANTGWSAAVVSDLSPAHSQGRFLDNGNNNSVFRRFATPPETRTQSRTDKWYIENDVGVNSIADTNVHRKMHRMDVEVDVGEGGTMGIV
jgi:hypothetical protein